MEEKRKLSELLLRLRAEGLLKEVCVGDDKTDGGCPDEIQITSVSADSRTVRPGCLFICKGLGFKPEYLSGAVAAGAVACLAEEDFGERGAVTVTVSDVRAASSLAASWFYGDPGESLSLIGITGTKGKTTTASVLREIFDEEEPDRTALFLTGRVDTIASKYENHLTTPEPTELESYLGESAAAGCSRAVMEVSSQAMKFRRVYGLTFDIGIFLNLDEDHIGGNEHESLEDYIECKTDFMRQCRTVIINRDTAYLDRVLAKAQGADRQILFGRDESCDAVIRNEKSCAGGMSFELCCGDKLSCGRKVLSLTTGLIGAFNVDNVAAAVIAALEAGVGEEAIGRAVRTASVPGRMIVLKVNGFTVVIDYAHNHLSFLRLYEAVRQMYAPERIISLFGCPGERSRVRRRDLGLLADEYAVEVFLTADDPGYEETEDICREIKDFIPHRSCHIIADRREAVRQALCCARPGDVVILGGKGGETTQRVRGHFEAYDSDESVVREWMSENNSGHENMVML